MRGSKITENKDFIANVSNGQFLYITYCNGKGGIAKGDARGDKGGAALLDKNHPRRQEKMKIANDVID